jgi:hypothetical protein
MPRTGASDRYGNALYLAVVPVRAINDSYEAALIELATPGSSTVIVVGSQRVVREKLEGLLRWLMPVRHRQAARLWIRCQCTSIVRTVRNRGVAFCKCSRGTTCMR